MNGFVYVMSNKSFADGRLKIGISSSEPASARSEELYTTGVPEPFKVEYFAFVADYEDVERRVHERLADKRPNPNREFFACTVPEAILVIRDVASIKYEENLYQSPHEIEEEQANQEKARRGYEVAMEILRKAKERDAAEKREREAQQKEDRAREEMQARSESWRKEKKRILHSLAWLAAMVPILGVGIQGGMPLFIVLVIPYFYWLWKILFMDTDIEKAPPISAMPLNLKGPASNAGAIALRKTDCPIDLNKKQWEWRNGELFNRGTGKTYSSPEHFTREDDAFEFGRRTPYVRVFDHEIDFGDAEPPR